MDPVNPNHYQVYVPLYCRIDNNVRIECADVIDALGLDHHTASAFEYIWRHKHKGGAVDLYKAKWRIERAIECAEHKDTTDAI